MEEKVAMPSSGDWSFPNNPGRGGQRKHILEEKYPHLLPLALCPEKVILIFHDQKGSDCTLMNHESDVTYLSGMISLFGLITLVQKNCIIMYFKWTHAAMCVQAGLRPDMGRRGCP